MGTLWVFMGIFYLGCRNSHFRFLLLALCFPYKYTNKRPQYQYFWALPAARVIRLYYTGINREPALSPSVAGIRYYP